MFTLVGQDEAQRMLLGLSPPLQVDEGALRLAGSGGKEVSAEGSRGEGGEEGEEEGGEESVGLRVPQPRCSPHLLLSSTC